MAVEAIDLKGGNVFEKDGKLLRVLKANHHKPGKGNTVMQMTLKDVRSGSIVQTTMRPSEKVEMVDIGKKAAQYLYAQGETYIFMDTETYEQYELSEDQISEAKPYLIPNMEVQLEYANDTELVGIGLPSTVDLKVIETQPGIKGATAASGGKPATMETGLVVTVPDFVNVDDVLTINTTTGEYKSRAN